MPPSTTVQAFADSLGIDLSVASVWEFGDSEAMAYDLAALVIAGRKTATCALEWSYLHDNTPVPKAGDISIVTTFGGGRPLAVIETVEVSIGPMSMCTEDFARAEGEGDLTLAWWRKAHTRFFARECARIGRPPHDDMQLVYERFRLLHVAP